MHAERGNILRQNVGGTAQIEQPKGAVEACGAQKCYDVGHVLTLITRLGSSWKGSLTRSQRATQPFISGRPIFRELAVVADRFSGLLFSPQHRVVRSKTLEPVIGPSGSVVSPDPPKRLHEHNGIRMDDLSHNSIGSITMQLGKLQRGNSDVTQAIFDFYFTRLTALARQMIPSHQKRLADEDDVVMEVLATFFLDTEEGKLPELKSREDVWRILARRIRQRASNLRRDQNRLKRGGGRVSGESAFISPGGDGEGAGIGQVADESWDRLSKLHDELLESLQNESLREIAQGLLEGLSPEAIAEKSGKSRATIYRKLGLIRDIWQETQR